MAGQAIRLLRKKEQDAREKTVFIHEFIPGTVFLFFYLFLLLFLLVYVTLYCST